MKKHKVWRYLFKNTLYLSKRGSSNFREWKMRGKWLFGRMSCYVQLWRKKPTKNSNLVSCHGIFHNNVQMNSTGGKQKQLFQKNDANCMWFTTKFICKLGSYTSSYLKRKKKQSFENCSVASGLSWSYKSLCVMKAIVSFTDIFWDRSIWTRTNVAILNRWRHRRT